MTEALERPLVERLAAFFDYCMNDGSWQGHDIDGGCAQDKAVALGLLIRTTYDPAVHGENDYGVEPGEDWYVFAPDAQEALSAQRPSTPSSDRPNP